MSDEEPKPKKCKKDCGSPLQAKKKKEPQNGKGDFPRNMSPQFRNNYDKIKWDSAYIKKT